ncbi:MAG: hypothetical protein ACO3BO_03225, partial [Anaerohalosphaeraceae bacterium]
MVVFIIPCPNPEINCFSCLDSTLRSDGGSNYSDLLDPILAGVGIGQNVKHLFCNLRWQMQRLLV